MSQRSIIGRGNRYYNFGKALRCESTTNSHAEMPTSFITANPDHSFIVSAWIKFSTQDLATAQGIVGNVSGVSYNGLHIQDDGAFQLRNIHTQKRSFETMDLKLRIGLWNHVLMENRVSVGSRLWFNGVENTNGVQPYHTSFNFKSIGTLNTYVRTNNYYIDQVLLKKGFLADPAATAAAIWNRGYGADVLDFIPAPEHLYNFNDSPANEGTDGGVATLVAGPTYERHF